MRRTFLLPIFRPALNGVSQIFLQAHPVCGLLMLMTIAIYAPSLLIGTLLGLLSGTLAASLLGYPRDDIATGLYGYNPALLGILITLVLGTTPLTLLLIVGVGTLSSVLQRYLLCAMRERGGPGVFTLSFVLLGWLSLAMAGMFDSIANAPVPVFGPNGWQAITAMASGVGQVMFVDEPEAGLCVLLALLIADKRAGLWALCGSAVGVYCALLAGTAEESWALVGLAGYNPALAALALSQVHRSALAPALGIALAIIGKLAFDRLGVPALTMPFILACWAVALGIRLTQRQCHTQRA